MDISDLISLETIYPNLKASSKKQLLQELGSIANSKIEKEPFEIASILMERERLGSTGVGHGVAIPHGRFGELDHIFGVFAKLEKPINFDSMDDQPVDLVFLLMVPEEAGADHLKALAKVSRVFRDQGICEKLRGADNSDAIFAILNASQ
ncbi:PTS IIA-like nitrogen regulatory protein PtsN [Pseudemcibacter aquimaris]|uniref:PTS IIA-like nitrogen regulatory protein PtsN n=1 Tax=Pseudemcibacter aquimaris TaxID=2857064 RepID=UPI00201273D6|nr:PTS IIA-like nitrogen regulatory protein PtsN [Pseudemcibacter aquimaris]MCC3860374.1 PTS IIA-like nitrogen regulatory protein PtsN [Pseudemcibacter aquimaris]WDU57700.1 PTS IIA-like nitrogen regulatory protein PtsN [Pseudemcibacter aquimaris]